MAIQAVVFDAFETLFHNSKDLWQDCVHRICREQGLDAAPEALWDAWHARESAFRRTRLDVDTMTPGAPFLSYAEAWRGAFQGAFDDLRVDGDADDATARFMADLGARPAFPETLRALAGLRGRVAVAVLSNADDAYLYPVLARHGLDGAFAAVLSSEEARLYKPHPAIFAQMLDRLGTSPAETLMVGDTLLEDVYGSHLAGMPSAWVNRYGAPMDGRVPPTYQLHSLDDLAAVLDGAAVSGRSLS